MVTTPAQAAFHEQMHVIEDRSAGLRGVIAINSSALGPAAGGCRLWNYPDFAALGHDAMRLSQGMSYKNALAGLPFGGGKAVLQLPEPGFCRNALFEAFGRAVEGLEGAYITAEDVGTTIEDMASVSQQTRFVAGLNAKACKAGGDPSPWTARGVFLAMCEAVNIVVGKDISEVTVAIQGLGNVGSSLARLLRGAGARLIVADYNTKLAKEVAAELSAKCVDPSSILASKADVLAPCALGAVFNSENIWNIRARVICGAANNQLRSPDVGDQMAANGIVYAPDYLVNAGGIINVAAEYLGETAEVVAERIEAIPSRLSEILERSRRQQLAPHRVADAMAESLIIGARFNAAA